MPDKRPSIARLKQLCQKPNSKTIGNWMARRVSRPMALRVTWLIAPLKIPADLVTLFAWVVGLAAAVAFAFGQPYGWVIGAVLLQLWYLLDHVDGQLARLYKTESLDGAGLDYLMHHSLGVAVPLGVGFGLSFELSLQNPAILNSQGTAAGQVSMLTWVLPAAIAWALGVQLVVAFHDTRYKAFAKRLKRLKGKLLVEGGSGVHPTPTTGPPIRPDRLLLWSARKLCEQHVTMNLLTLLAIFTLFMPKWGHHASLIYVALMAIAAWMVAIWSIGRSVLQRDAESEFAAWYQTPEGKTLRQVDGWWLVESEKSPPCER